MRFVRGKLVSGSISDDLAGENFSAHNHKGKTPLTLCFSYLVWDEFLTYLYFNNNKKLIVTYLEVLSYVPSLG